MNYEDKEIICKECGTAFMWSAGEQEFFEQKGLQNIPSRCPICRKKKDVKHQYQNSYDITCRICQKKSQSPFSPQDPTDILCNECFKKEQEKVSAPPSQIDDAGTMESSY